MAEESFFRVVLNLEGGEWVESPASRRTRRPRPAPATSWHQLADTSRLASRQEPYLRHRGRSSPWRSLSGDALRVDRPTGLGLQQPNPAYPARAALRRHGR